MDAPTREQETIDALIARGVPDAPAGGDCPAPDVLAAFQERTLETDETARWLRHIADCRRCQTLLAAIGRAESDAGAEHAPRGSAAFPWWRSHVLAPLAAFSIVVLAVWVVDPWPMLDTEVAVEDRQDPTPAQGEQASAATEFAQATRVQQTTAPTVYRARADSRPGDADSRNPRPRARPRPSGQPCAALSTRRIGHAGISTAAGRDRRRRRPTRVACGFRAQRLRARRRTSARDSPVRRRSARERRPDRGTRPYDTVAGHPSGWRGTIGQPGRHLAVPDAPRGSGHRRLGPLGARGLARRRERAGAAYHHGERWERTTAPVTTDLSDVYALDGLVATVSTADGRRFRTVDGVARWTPLP